MAQNSVSARPALLIAETRPTLAAGLQIFLADIPDTRPVAIMAGFDHVVDYAERHEIALIIVGQGMNGASPLSEFRRLRRKYPAARLVLLADVADRDTIVAALSEGASGVIPTSIDEHDLESAITRILAGSIYIPHMAAPCEQRHPGWHSGGAGSEPRPLLTPRQYEVLGVLAQGKSNKEIAAILGISDSTVSMHLNSAYVALGVHDRTSAALAYRNMPGRDPVARIGWASDRTHSRFERQAQLALASS